MANLTTSPSFDGVYQYETSDPVLGGVPVVGSPTKQGIDNWQGQALANRDAFLKQRTDQLERAVTDAGLTYNANTVTQLTTAINTLTNTALAGVGLNVTNAPVVSDCNTYRASGLYRANASTTNTPVAGRTYTLLHLLADVQQSCTQVAVEVVNAGNIFIRQSTLASGWGAWRQLANGVFTLGDEIRGAVPTWTSNTTLTMGAGFDCADSARSTRITIPNATVINFATTGLNGLDTGSIASDTWYTIHAIANPTTGATGYIASTSQTSPTMPSGFTVRRLLQYQVKTRSDGATIQPFRFFDNGQEVRCEWQGSEFDRANAVIFSQTGMGSSTAYVVDASSSVPPVCNGTNAKLIASVWQDTTTGGGWTRLSVDAGTDGNWNTLSVNDWVAEDWFEIPLYPNSRQFRIRNDAGLGGWRGSSSASTCTGIVHTRGYVFYYKGVV